MNNNPQKGGKPALPQVGGLDTVSPATRLLEKRRLMYENQEKFMDKKKEFQQAEIAFKTQEKVLRDQDSEIQEQIIKFANYLDLNSKAMRKCDEQVSKLEEGIKEKDEEIKKKQFWLKVLKEKASRIDKQKRAVEQYQDFLIEVKEANPDEYSEIKKILERYETLESSQIKLKADQAKMEADLVTRQSEVNRYENSMNTSIMQLNNDIGNKKKEQDFIQQKVSQLNSKEQESSTEQISKIKKLSRVVMAVNALEKACLHRKQNIIGLEESQKKSLLNYQGKNFFAQGGATITVPTTFDNYDDRFNYAMKQLDVIERYMQDFKSISEQFKKNQMYGTAAPRAEE